MKPDDLSWMDAKPIRPTAWHLERRHRALRRALWLALAAVLIGAATAALW